MHASRPASKPAAESTVEREGLRPRLQLYSYFCDFYTMLVEVKQALSAAPATASALQRAPGREPAAVHERLLDQLRAQYSTVQKDCTPDQCDVYRDAQYAMAALADEQLLLEVDWSGRSAWLDLMLESALFDTRIAGVRFYRLIDRLLVEPAPTHGRGVRRERRAAAGRAGRRPRLRRCTAPR